MASLRVNDSRQKAGERTVAGFTSILFPGSGAMTGVDAPLDCFSDLHLDQIIGPVTAGMPTINLTGSSMHCCTRYPRPSAATRYSATSTAKKHGNVGMATMRRRLHQTQHLWHPLQRQGWFVYAVETFCDAVALLRNGLNRVEPASRGLCDFAHHVAAYVDSDRFQALVADTKAARDLLHKVRCTVHIEGLRVHVDKFAGQPDYSAGITARFEWFAT